MSSREKPDLARRFIVRGRVQGVGFRWFVEREAHVLGISGWVRNNSDGSVDDVEEFESKPVPGLTAFRIEGAW